MTGQRVQQGGFTHTGGADQRHGGLAIDPGANTRECVRIQGIGGFHGNPGLRLTCALHVGVHILSQVCFGQHNDRHGTGFGTQGQVAFQTGFFEFFVAGCDDKEYIHVGGNGLNLSVSPGT